MRNLLRRFEALAPGDESKWADHWIQVLPTFCYHKNPKFVSVLKAKERETHNTDSTKTKIRKLKMEPACDEHAEEESWDAKNGNPCCGYLSGASALHSLFVSLWHRERWREREVVTKLVVTCEWERPCEFIRWNWVWIFFRF